MKRKRKADGERVREIVHPWLSYSRFPCLLARLLATNSVKSKKRHTIRNGNRNRDIDMNIYQNLEEERKEKEMNARAWR